jgi:uncharacterized membrane protein YgdD (TMEM256/DUF423 family)
MLPLSPLSRRFLLAAGILGALSVAIGAFDSHGLSAYFAANPDREPTFNTAVQYHQVHALALLLTALLHQIAPSRWTRLAGIAFVIGIIVFAGALYLLSVLQLRFMGAIAPVGGAALIAGWLCLALAAWRGGR